MTAPVGVLSTLATKGIVLSNMIKRNAAKIALGTIAVSLFTPAVAEAVGSFNFGTSPKSFTQSYVWSRYEDSLERHGSSAYGDVNGLVRSTCKAPGVRAYAESVYSNFGGSHTSYYRLC